MQNVNNHIYFDDNKSGFFSAVYTDYGHYQVIQDLIKATNKTLAKNVSDNIKLTVNALTGKVTVHIKNGYKLVLTGRMSIIFGFGGKETLITKTTESPYVADLPQIVGYTSAQLLKTIPVEGKFGDVIAKPFTNIEYVYNSNEIVRKCGDSYKE